MNQGAREANIENRHAETVKLLTDIRALLRLILEVQVPTVAKS